MILCRSQDRQSSEERNSVRERSSDRHSSDSSESTSEEEEEDEEDSNESNKASDAESNDGSDYNNPSPLSVDRLAKSDHSEGESPGHIESNGAPKELEKEEVEKKEEEPELPPYLPAIQGNSNIFFNNNFFIHRDNL